MACGRDRNNLEQSKRAKSEFNRGICEMKLNGNVGLPVTFSECATHICFNWHSYSW